MTGNKDKRRATAEAAAAFGLEMGWTDGDEPTRPVDLTLEETGILCHLLLPRIMEMERTKHAPPVSRFDTEDIREAVGFRMSVLYEKLAAANDELMGKNKERE